MNVPNALACSERKPHQKTSLPNTPAGNEQVRAMSVAATMSTMANVRCAVYSPRRHGRNATRAPHDGSLVDEGDGDGCDGGTLLTDAMWTTPIDHFNQTLDLQARQSFLLTTNLSPCDLRCYQAPMVRIYFVGVRNNTTSEKYVFFEPTTL